MKIKVIVFIILFCISCSKKEARRPISSSSSNTLFSETINEYKSLVKIEEDEILKLIKRDSINNFIQSKQGFWYSYVLKLEDSFRTPKKGDEVLLSYNIKDLNDSIIYSKDDLGLKKYKVDEEDFISGLQKGIKLMKIGETITFIIPSYNAFGITGDGNKIGINQPIKSTLTLININN